MSGYEARPWLARYGDVMLGQTEEPHPTFLHAFRNAVDLAPDRTAPASIDGPVRCREADEISGGSRAPARPVLTVRSVRWVRRSGTGPPREESR